MMGFLSVCWDILVDSSVWMLFGFFMAGLLRAFVPADIVARHLGRNRSGNVFKAAVFGIPLPLCSCGVIPAAAGLRRLGASRGATASFLISTPETGVDSIGRELGPARPAYDRAPPGVRLCHGHGSRACSSTLRTGKVKRPRNQRPQRPQRARPAHPAAVRAAAKQRLRRISPLARFLARPAMNNPCPQSPRRGGVSSTASVSPSMILLGDIAPWFGVGILLAGLITLYLPEDIGAMLPGGGAMLVMLLISLPMYVCATASTPIAAALALKGFSPGALLVFLLAGPATNAATILMVGKLLGRRSAVMYVGVHHRRDSGLRPGRRRPLRHPGLRSPCLARRCRSGGGRYRFHPGSPGHAGRAASLRGPDGVTAAWILAGNKQNGFDVSSWSSFHRNTAVQCLPGSRIPYLRILPRRVLGLTSRISAAPPGPFTLPPAASRALVIASTVAASRVFSGEADFASGDGAS